MLSSWLFDAIGVPSAARLAVLVSRRGRVRIVGRDGGGELHRRVGGDVVNSVQGQESRQAEIMEMVRLMRKGAGSSYLSSAATFNGSKGSSRSPGRDRRGRHALDDRRQTLAPGPSFYGMLPMRPKLLAFRRRPRRPFQDDVEI